MLSFEFCHIFLKNSKFNWTTSIQVFKVSVISYCLKRLFILPPTHMGIKVHVICFAISTYFKLSECGAVSMKNTVQI